jgi:hypothetical protein
MRTRDQETGSARAKAAGSGKQWVRDWPTAMATGLRWRSGRATATDRPCARGKGAVRSVPPRPARPSPARPLRRRLPPQSNGALEGIYGFRRSQAFATCHPYRVLASLAFTRSGQNPPGRRRFGPDDLACPVPKMWRRTARARPRFHRSGSTTPPRVARRSSVKTRAGPSPGARGRRPSPAAPRTASPRWPRGARGAPPGAGSLGRSQHLVAPPAERGQVHPKAGPPHSSSDPSKGPEEGGPHADILR